MSEDSEDSDALEAPEELEEPEEPEELEEPSPDPELPSPNPGSTTPPLPIYNPPEDRPGRPQNITPGLSPFQLFQLFFTIEDITTLIEQSNPRAIARGFRPLKVSEFYRYLGCLIYMGVYKYPEIRDYWRRNVSGARLGLSRDRFSEIQAVFTFRNPETNPKQADDPWWFRLEPLASNIRRSCQRYWIPGAKVAIDEGMVAYHGHTRHTIKAPHKPIKQGFKFWALGDHGYIYSWLWYSRTDGTEATRRSRTLAETQNLVLNLAQKLPRNIGYNLYLDNLFTNIPLAKQLLQINVGMTGTTRKNALGYPKWLAQLKEQGKARDKALEWGAMRAEVVEKVLCFAWQDNNTVLGMTSGYRPGDLVVRSRKRPAETSTNAAIVRPVFGEEYTKDLAIPRLIDDYNHHMGGVDIANQLRVNYTTHTRRQKRYWKAIFLWLLDLAITNSYLLSQWPRPPRGGAESRAHRKFMDALAKSLMEMPLELVPGPPDIDPAEPNIDPLDLDSPHLPHLNPSVPSHLDPSGPSHLDLPHLDQPYLDSPHSDLPYLFDSPRLDPTVPSGPSHLDPSHPDLSYLDSPHFNPSMPSGPSHLDLPYLDSPYLDLPHLDPSHFNPPNQADPSSLDIAPPDLEPRAPDDVEGPELLEPEIHVREKREKRACVYCQQNKKDWKPHKHGKPIHHGQVSRAFGTDVTNIATYVPTIGKDTRGYRVRGSKTVWYCGTCNVALCKQGSCWNLWHNLNSVEK